nr:acyl-CoA carboxylase subunit beta [Flexivirga aerilata]
MRSAPAPTTDANLPDLQADSMPTLVERTAELARLRATVLAGPDQRATERQHARNKLTARERIDLLLDQGSFREIETFRRHRATGFGLENRRPATDGVITGWGTVYGRKVFVYAHDFRIFGGALGEAHAQKICKVLDLAVAARCPIVGINDGAGARIQEGVTALAGYGEIFRRHVAASGVIPQISVIAGPCAGGAAYSPALTDFVFTIQNTSQMFVTGPDVVAAVTGEEVTMNDLGGAVPHSQKSGVAHFAHPDEPECFADVRYLLSLLPRHNQERPPIDEGLDDPVDRRLPELTAIVPADPATPYDMREVIDAVVDDQQWIEIHENWAKNILCALGRIGGEVVGVVANQPLVLAGALDIAAAEKAARFVTMCDSLGISLVTLVDVPGFMPGVDQEHGGIIRHGAKLLYAYCNATVPRVQVIVRKAYGGAYIVMDSRSIGCDLSFAWPTNEVAVMGAEGAASIIFRREIAQADDPDQVREDRINLYRDELMHPYYAAERGLVDDIIDPADTRAVLCDALSTLATKRVTLSERRHGNQPA